MRIPLLLSFLALTIGLRAQTTFAPEGATWTYSVFNPWTGSSFPITFTALGDTTVQDRTCQRIDVGGTLCTYFDFDGVHPSLLTCMSGDSVLWFDGVTEEFKLLVPFNALPGSSWQVTVRSYVDDPSVVDIARFTVTGVSTLEVDGQELRRLHVTQEFITSNGYLRFNTATGIFTERLGHDLFLIPWFRQCADAPMPTGLICYSDPDMSWPDPDVPCGTTTGIAEQARQAELSVTPTIAEPGAPIRVSAAFPPSARARWQVTDVLGRRLQEGAFQGSARILTLEHTGTFLITVWTDRGAVLSQRVVVR